MVWWTLSTHPPLQEVTRGAAPSTTVCHRRHLTIDRPAWFIFAPRPSTPSCSEAQWSSPAQPSCTSPPPPLLTVDECRHRAIPVPRRCPATRVSHVILSLALATGGSTPSRLSHRQPPRHRIAPGGRASQANLTTGQG
jgi:hypothetical protein